ncbi:MAG: hypothetical protein J1G05_04880 [Clostridiales bacterium]|nr:hypothetical protein [Clostridiales bacterium]
MEKLIKSTTAYRILSGDRQGGKLSHAYMLHFEDAKNMRDALKLFALEFFGAEKGSTLCHRILNESYPDLRVYPEAGKKFMADGAAEIIEDSALRPVEGDKKLYIICGFDTASALIQNKLLKSLEEPLEGIHYLLGVTSLAPVLDTVKSRVKLLEIPPFSEREIFEALERKGHSELNREAAASANGYFGAAENIVEGGWYSEIRAAAKKICFTTQVGEVGQIAAEFGDTKYKTELLSEMQRLYFTALTEGGELAGVLKKPALIFALEKLNGANADVRFNAFFQGLLYDFMLGVIEENDKWQKL